MPRQSKFSRAAAGIFPIVLPYQYTGRGGQVTNNMTFAGIYHANRRPDVTWYAYDVTIHDPTTVSFKVYDAKHNYAEITGVGDLLYDTGPITVPEELTRPYITKEIRFLAQVIREEELAAQEAAIVAKYTRNIRTNLSRRLNR